MRNTLKVKKKSAIEAEKIGPHDCSVTRKLCISCQDDRTFVSPSQGRGQEKQTPFESQLLYYNGRYYSN